MMTVPTPTKRRTRKEAAKEAERLRQKQMFARLERFQASDRRVPPSARRDS